MRSGHVGVVLGVIGGVAVALAGNWVATVWAAAFTLAQVNISLLERGKRG